MNQENKPFVTNYHHKGNHKNYRLVFELLSKAISENKLEINLVECDWDKLEAEREKVRRLVEAIKKYTEYNYSAILEEAIKEIEDL